MMPEPSDRRVQKTRQILQKAIMELIVEKGIDAITVKDILDRANVGRSTFYAHYQDKEELLHSCFDNFHKLIENNFLKSANNNPDKGARKIEMEFIAEFLKFAADNQQVLKALLSQQQISEFVKASISASFYTSFKNNVGNGKSESIPPEIKVQYFVNAFFGTVKWWIDNNLPYSVEEMERYIKQLVIPILKSN